jgi:ABC-type lipoprotein release transport system permease subunit
MIWTIAWRNIWRNKKRSAIIICAIAFGLWAGIVTMALSLGMMQQMVNSAIETSLSHIQLHRPGFIEHKEIRAIIPNGTEVLAKVRNFPGVSASVGRAIILGMANTTATATGVEIYGIEPEKERKVTNIGEKIIEGDYFQTSRKNPIVIGVKLAERLKTKVGSKIVLTAQAQDSSISAGAFRVVGIYRTESSMFDEVTVYALKDDIDNTFGLGGEIHEIALKLNNPEAVDSLRDRLAMDFPTLQVDSWKQLSKILASYIEMGIQMMDIFMIVLLLTMLFGMTNTLLMGIMERVRELGVVMALGMNPVRIFSMILLESILLSLVGGIIGIIIGAVSIEILAKYGLDLSDFSAALAEFGVSQVTYPYLPLSQYPKITLMVIVTAIIAAIFPGIKAVRLNPLKAIRSY